MIYCPDTDTCIFALRGRFPSLLENFRQLPAQRIKIPSIVRAELFLGALKSSDTKNSLHLMEKFLEPFEIISFGENEATAYARIKFELEKGGCIIGPNDLVIAATILAHQATLVTHNTKEFKRVPGLLVEDWTQ